MPALFKLHKKVHPLKEFVIPFVGLKLGNHTFEFDVDHKFFSCFEESELSKSHIKVVAELEKSERMLIFYFTLSGTVEVLCDRCAGAFDLEISGEEKLIVRFGAEADDEDADVMILEQDETKVDLSGVIYDYINLLVPFRRVHPETEEGESGCDPEMLARLEAMKPAAPADPRWDKLKDLNTDS